ncbi:helix-turn-helix transcriptional regulator [Vibrio sp. D404a]|uniref:helix-turn-helix domain-containing protein n=1 Tax=unclassified Vibrio TaxID=2614977 RepID=UPI002554155A|nr:MULTISPECIES: AraC family transcriptional regulator [unclassified Vibrio]MDK9735707.1 helix-turn-helix transcriptional regulator [Vibrio sp. D404a]MDK9798623.1 helix-turn-helix transcriptional regulator [Vibrio sp. D449a]
MSDIVHIKAIAQIHKALGLPAPVHPLVSLIQIDERVTNYDYGDTTYVYDFYQIAFKSGITGDITYGRNHYDYDQGSMVFTKPGQAQHYSNTAETEDEHGWVLLFHPDLIRRSGLASHMDGYSFFSYDTNEALHVSEREKNILSDLIYQIEEEYSQNIDKHTQRLIVSNIELILNYCTRYYERQFLVRQNHNLDLMERVDIILNQYFESDNITEKGLPTVKYLSEAMCMSSSYLSDMMKNATGRNAQQYIQDQLIERIKNALLSTNEQVSQIAYGLGFEYPQHLSKLFKAKTGMTPVEYRKSVN